MTTLPTGCSSERIQSFLSGALAADEQAEFENHLTHCSSCRVSLEDAAADPDFWNESQSQLAYWGDVTDDLSLTTSNSAAGSDLANNPLMVLRGLLVPSDDPHSMGRLAAYEVMGLVGRGGMGIVVKAFDPGLNRNVAIKILASDMAAHGAARQRFAREARAAAAVVHENVMAIHAVAEARGVPFLVMPYIRGGSLERRLQEQGPQPVDAIVRVGLQVAAGLAAAHGQGLVHRDIKPANILLEEGTERVRITDFGLARAADDASMTMTGVIAGTPQYMSPEQAGGEVIDARSDLFSLGSVMYAMAAGRAPFRAETSLGVLRLIREQRARPIRSINAAIPDWLADVIDTLHEKRPENRYSSAAEVALLLRQCMAHLQQPLISPLPAVLRNNWWRRRLLRRPSALTLVAGVALVATTTAVVYRWPGVSGSTTAGSQHQSGSYKSDQSIGDESILNRDPVGSRVGRSPADSSPIDNSPEGNPPLIRSQENIDSARTLANTGDASSDGRIEKNLYGNGPSDISSFADLESAIDQRLANLNSGVDQLRRSFIDQEEVARSTESPATTAMPAEADSQGDAVGSQPPSPVTPSNLDARSGTHAGSDTGVESESGAGSDLQEGVPPVVELPEEIPTESPSESS